MTLLNTVANLGYMWVMAPSLLAMEVLEAHTCSVGGAPCASAQGAEACAAARGSCIEERDGFTWVVGAALLLGAAWLAAMLPRARQLQGQPLSAWRA